MALRLASRQARLVVFGYNAVTSRIEWVRSPASPQYAGSPLSLSGGQVMAYYKDGTASDITASCGYDPEEGSLLEYAGELNINATYTDHAGNEFTADTQIDVADVDELFFTGLANPTQKEGTALDLSGAVLSIRYTDGTTRSVDASSVTFEPAAGEMLSHMDSLSVQAVWRNPATGSEYTAEYTVTIDQVDGIYFAHAPNKSHYAEGEPLDLTGSTIALKYKKSGDIVMVTPSCTFYAESGVSGTKADTRPELQRLMQDCEAGTVDVIVTKSISRFARNTSECLEMVRRLTSLGIRLIFEKENIDTETMESEFLLTLLAAFAESESASISTNQKWAIRKRFQAGTYKGGKVPYGYRRTKKGYIIHPVEAATVRRIFYALADGKGTLVIARELNEERIPTWTESYKGLEAQGKWRSNSIIAIARNEFYTGDSLYQKTFMENYKKCVNTGQLDQYLNEADHPAIIDHATFEQANAMIKSHGERLGREKAVKDTKRYVFSGRLICGFCGGHMRRGKDARAFYACENHIHKRTVMVEGTEAPCPMLPVFEQDVKNAFATVLNRLAADTSILAITDDGEAERERLEAQLQSVRRRQSVLHDRALADRYTAQLREKKAALDSEEKTILDALAKLEKKNPVDDLKRAVVKRGVRESFEISDEKLFTAFVDHAVLWSKEKVQFYFTCGLVVEEDMRIEKVGRSYTEVPVRTEFDEQKGAFTWQ